MELKQLKYFIAVIESGSLGKAAKNLDIGTSALSQQISKLESELSIRRACKLFCVSSIFYK